MFEHNRSAFDSKFARLGVKLESVIAISLIAFVTAVVLVGTCWDAFPAYRSYMLGASAITLSITFLATATQAVSYLIHNFLPPREK